MTRLALALLAAAPALAGEIPALPNPALTPGETYTSARDRICAPGYARSMRPSEDASRLLKELVARRYASLMTEPGIIDIREYELDHLVPLCLGGDSHVENLWLQPWPEARRKDRLEAEQCRAVCDGRISLDEAQGYFLSGQWAKDLGR